MIIGIIGNGFVGKSTYILKNDNIEILTYDINPNLCQPFGLKLEEMSKCEIIFISVPTPMNKDGSVCVKIVQSVVNDLKNINYGGFIVIRSTVIPGTSDNLGCYFMPEFLTEKNYLYDFKNNPLWIFGLKNEERDEIFKKKITKLINYAYENGCINSKNIEWMSNKEAEMVKYFRNTFLSLKVSYCNEIYQYCQLKGINYNRIRNIAASDSRIGLSHTMVPGHDGKMGYGGTCFPKDTNGLLCDMKKMGMKSYILENTVKRNEKVDRKEKDWLLDKGRVII